MAAVMVLLGCGDDSLRGRGQDTSVVSSKRDGAVMVDAVADAGETKPPEIIYAHDRNHLFVFDANTRSVTRDVEMTLEGSSEEVKVLDIAIDKDGRAFAAGGGYIYSLDVQSGQLEPVAEMAYGAALSFVSTEEPGIGLDREPLLVDSEGDIYLADPVSGQLNTFMMNVQLAVDAKCETSGDFVSIEGLGTYVTLKCNDRRYDMEADYLGKIDFLSRQIQIIGPVVNRNGEGFRQIFGLAFWGDELFGFTNNGDFLSISPDSGVAELLGQQTGADSFWGAGVTTRAVVVR